ncbi:MAG: outer membrane lipoprotein-sorting protein [Oligoflexales bacterium]|nr:outer membrane lipoprotein-sorting protein [Oligoflexales bacterium]
MSLSRNKLFIIVLSLLGGWPAFSAESKLSANQILSKVDDTVNAPRDQEIKATITLVDRDGKEKQRQLVITQKGSDRRMAKFLSPADQKGIAFLSLPDDVTYLYLPAFGKTRRIASHVKNTKFAGTDFSYEDMEAKRFSRKFTPVLVKDDSTSYTLELTPKKDAVSDYSKIVMQVGRESFIPLRMDLYDKSGKLSKIATQEKIEKISGYWTALKSTMEDKKENHRTIMSQTETKFDQNLSDDRFTERYLAK